jgi:benzoate transport
VLHKETVLRTNSYLPLDWQGAGVYSFRPLRKTNHNKRQQVMTSITDPREIIDNSKMTTLQILIVGITVLLNAMDGFDVLVISTSANAIAAEWGISRAALGFVLSAELAGMAAGSILIGGYADKIGRRSTLLLCLAIMASGMILTTTVNDPYMLCVWRVFTGLGIGGMLSCTNAVVAEFSNKKRRALCVSLMVIGYPAGGIFIGELSKYVLTVGEWRDLFTIGAVMAALLIPVIYFMVPESVHWLARKQPENALARINKSLTKMGHAAIDGLPELPAQQQKTSVMDIFSPSLRMITILLTVGYFFHIITFYFILKWTPVIVVDFMGMAGNLAPGVLTWVNVGGVLGGLTFGVMASKFGLKPLTIGLLVLTTIAIIMFGNTNTEAETLAGLNMVAMVAGFFGNAGISGLYSLIAYSFPAHVKATGTGFVIGVGRGGAFISPIIAGFLLDWNLSLPVIATIMGGCSVLGAITLMNLKKVDHDSASEADGQAA